MVADVIAARGVPRAGPALVYAAEDAPPSVRERLRELSRAFVCAIALVHRARKGTADEPGQGLRGSSDFHAWGDSNLYVRRVRDGLLLCVEHRAAASPPPVGLALIATA